MKRVPPKEWQLDGEPLVLVEGPATFQVVVVRLVPMITDKLPWTVAPQVSAQTG